MGKERVRAIGAILFLDTTGRYACPRFERKLDETAEQFADRVRDELLKLQVGT